MGVSLDYLRSGVFQWTVWFGGISCTWFWGVGVKLTHLPNIAIPFW